MADGYLHMQAISRDPKEVGDVFGEARQSWLSDQSCRKRTVPGWTLHALSARNHAGMRFKEFLEYCLIVIISCVEQVAPITLHQLAVTVPS